MRVQDLPSDEARVARTPGRNADAKTPARLPGGRDRVVLSGLSQRAASYLNRAAGSERIRRAVEAGEYHVDPLEVGRRIVQFYIGAAG